MSLSTKAWREHFQSSVLLVWVPTTFVEAEEKRAVFSSVGSWGPAAVERCSVFGLAELLVVDADGSSSLCFPDPMSPGCGPDSGRCWMALLYSVDRWGNGERCVTHWVQTLLWRMKLCLIALVIWLDDDASLECVRRFQREAFFYSHLSRFATVPLLSQLSRHWWTSTYCSFKINGG